eukprot:2208299-Lingulodinium_polyedra.AAC.1
MLMASQRARITTRNLDPQHGRLQGAGSDRRWQACSSPPCPLPMPRCRGPLAATRHSRCPQCPG